jgi:hypothetical protein
VGKFGPGNPGRPKGSKNKKPQELKDAILGALHAGAGAQAYCERLKEERPELFTQLVAKLIPKDVNVDVTGGLQVALVRSFVKKP